MALHRWSAGLAVVACVSTANAQQQQQASQIPIRQVIVEATSTEALRRGQVRAWGWPDGSVVATLRSLSPRLQLFDKDMKAVRTVVDSTITAASQVPFGSFQAMQFVGDTTMVVDPGNAAMLVVDRDGKTVRVMALPRAEDARQLA